MYLTRLAMFRHVCGFLMVLVALTGCASNGTSAASGHSAGTSSTLRIWYSTDDPVERVWSQQLAQRFQASHPAIHVQFTAYSFEDLNTKLQLALAGGDPPDLAYVTPRGPGIPAYVGHHKLLDLTAAARAGHWKEHLLPGLLSAYNTPFRFYGNPPDTISAVPTALAAVGVLYDIRLLHSLHLKVPQTLPALQHDLARARASGYVPIGIGNADGWLGDDWYLTLVNSLVPPRVLQPEQILSPNFHFTQPAFRQAGSILQTWSQRSYLTPDFGGLDAQEGIDQFFHGKTLFQLISSSEDPQISQDAQETHLPVGVFAFPTNRQISVMPQSGYLGWVVPRDGDNHRAAIEFINSLLSPSTTRFLVGHDVVPATRTGAGVIGAHTPSWLREYLQALHTSQPGVYLDAAPIANLNGTMEANVQLLLQGYEHPSFLVKSLQEVYSTRSRHGSTARIDGEF